jgi:hypothetical protein
MLFRDSDVPQIAIHWVSKISSVLAVRRVAVAVDFIVEVNYRNWNNDLQSK